MSFLDNDNKRARRRGYLVRCYVGPNGSGKSACMVRDCQPSLEAGRPVLSTVRIHDYENLRPCEDDWCASNPDVLDHFKLRPTPAGLQTMIANQLALFFYGPDAEQEEVERVSTGVHYAAHPGWIPWNNHEQLNTFNFGEVLADEITGIADSRAWASLPQMIGSKLQQLRRADIPVSYSTPDWAQADTNLRRPTQLVTLCRGYMPKQAPPVEGQIDRIVRIRRLYRWQSYDAQLLTEMDEGKRKDLKPEVVDWHWGPKSVAWDMYDTFAPVLTVGNPQETGICPKCMGKRPERPKCQCGTTRPRSTAAPVALTARSAGGASTGREAGAADDRTGSVLAAGATAASTDTPAVVPETAAAL